MSSLFQRVRARSDESREGRRKLFVAWSKLVGGTESPRECGLIRINGKVANVTIYTYLRDGHMTHESGDEINVDVVDFQAYWLSDAPVTVDNVQWQGSRWRVRADDSYLFIGWKLSEHGEPLPAGFAGITDKQFSNFEDRWEVVVSHQAGT